MKRKLCQNSITKSTTQLFSTILFNNIFLPFKVMRGREYIIILFQIPHTNIPSKSVKKEPLQKPKLVQPVESCGPIIVSLNKYTPNSIHRVFVDKLKWFVTDGEKMKENNKNRNNKKKGTHTFSARKKKLKMFSTEWSSTREEMGLSDCLEKRIFRCSFMKFYRLQLLFNKIICALLHVWKLQYIVF